MPLIKIISGGQTGADQAGLFAAEELGLKTGGMMPKGYRTDEGPRPDLADRFKLLCHQSENYPPRTWYNVQNSDATLLFGNLGSPGCSLTRVFAERQGKTFYLIKWPENDPPDHNKFFAEWLHSFPIQILNVAGNRESKNPGIFAACKAFLLRNLKEQ